MRRNAFAHRQSNAQSAQRHRKHWRRTTLCESFVSIVWEKHLLDDETFSFFPNRIKETNEICRFQAIPHYGILARSEVGLLVHYEETSTPTQVTQIPGSRLKTPSYPIWVTCTNGHFGIIFNTNRELLRNHLAERRYSILCTYTTVRWGKKKRKKAVFVINPWYRFDDWMTFFVDIFFNRKNINTYERDIITFPCMDAPF